MPNNNNTQANSQQAVRPEPNWIFVEGAGTRAVNGLYQRDGDLQGAPRFVMAGNWDGLACKFYMIRCAMRSQQKWWWISICPDEEQMGTDRDIDFYCHPINPHNIMIHNQRSSFPPTGRWRRTRQSVPGAVLPAPVVTPVHNPADMIKVKLETVKAMTEQVAMRVRCPRWELRIHRAIGEYVQTDALCFDTAACDELFQKHEFSECLNVVEMVFWKAVCLAEMPESVGQKGYHRVMHWIKQGWKVNKAAMRNSSSVNTLMELIIPFLEKPWETAAG